MTVFHLGFFFSLPPRIPHRASVMGSKGFRWRHGIEGSFVGNLGANFWRRGSLICLVYGRMCMMAYPKCDMSKCWGSTPVAWGVRGLERGGERKMCHLTMTCWTYIKFQCRCHKIRRSAESFGDRPATEVAVLARTGSTRVDAVTLVASIITASTLISITLVTSERLVCVTSTRPSRSTFARPSTVTSCCRC